MCFVKAMYYFFGEYLESGERVNLVCRRHILVMSGDFFKTFLVGFAFPVALFYFFPVMFWPMFLWMILGVLRVFYDIYDWYYRVWLITDRAIIDVRSPGLFDVSTTRIEYHMVEGVSYTVSGFFRTVFNYGDIILEKVGSGTSMTLEGASNPRRIERFILKYQEGYMEHHNYNSHETLKNLLTGMIYEHKKRGGGAEVKAGGESDQAMKDLSDAISVLEGQEHGGGQKSDQKGDERRGNGGLPRKIRIKRVIRRPS